MGKKRIVEKKAEEIETKIEAEAETRKVKISPSAIRQGIAHIQATYNNTLITISDEKGNVITWGSAGSIGFSGTKKATPFAATKVAEIVAEKAKRKGIQSVMVRVSGVGSGRDSAIRSLANHGIEIIAIKDVTPLPHNGPRPPKPRRV